MVRIDLNADLGEQPDSILDEQLMPFISSCNIASGGHVGNEETIIRTLTLACKHNVAIGVHPSFPDRKHFGRRQMNLSDEALETSLSEQITWVKALAGQVGASVRHVKPHGALYNISATNEKYARIIAHTVSKLDQKLLLYGMAHSRSEELAKTFDVPFVGEAFADRLYVGANELMNRNIKGAVLSEQDDVLDQVNDIVFFRRVKTEKGVVPVNAQTICLHSDTKGAVLLAKSIHQFIVSKGGQIVSF
ncbi:MAG: 5-oxoprolinase subunit PxpA [Bacteroidota bacterium]